jgi:hypothetical protein
MPNGSEGGELCNPVSLYLSREHRRICTFHVSSFLATLPVKDLVCLPSGRPHGVRPRGGASGRRVRRANGMTTAVRSRYGDDNASDRRDGRPHGVQSKCQCKNPRHCERKSVCDSEKEKGDICVYRLSSYENCSGRNAGTILSGELRQSNHNWSSPFKRGI